MEVKHNLAYENVQRSRNDFEMVKNIYEEPRTGPKASDCENNVQNHERIKTRKKKKVCHITVFISLTLAIAVTSLIISMIQYSLTQKDLSFPLQQNEVLQKRLNSTEQAVEVIQLQLSDMAQALLNSTEQQFYKLQKQLNSTQQQLTSSTETTEFRFDTFTETIRLLKSRISNTEQEISNFQSRITNTEQENTNFQGRISNTEQEISNLQTVRSCKDIPRSSKSGPFIIYTNNEYHVLYCDINPRSCQTCNAIDSRGWTRVANIDMRDNGQCPNGFKLITRTTPPLRTCGRPSGHTGCVSTTFPVHGIEYSRICGRVIGYQQGSPSGLYSYNEDGQTINGHFLSGISLTYGTSPTRQHIWAFVNAVTEAGSGYSYNSEVCPCTRTDIPYTSTVPPFIGNDYFCDTGINSNTWTDGLFYPDNPLWDGQGCGVTSTCCSFNSPPWFCKQLPQPTTQDIELRLCENSPAPYDDSPFEIVELYIN